MEDILRQPRKRPGDSGGDDTARPHDPLVASIMEQELANKRAKKGKADAPGNKAAQQKKKGLTLEEVEDLEGGTVKESKVGMAASRRADKRRQKGAGDETEMLPVTDLVDAEEALEQEADDGIALEPFNLAREREEGHFDEGGHYVEHKEEDDPTMRDAWLTSEDAGVASEEVRRKVEARNARLAASEAAPEITPRQAADLMRTLCEVLRAGESVNAAMRRLRPPAKRTGKRKGAAEPKKEPSAEERAAAAAFDRLAEAAGTLLDAGELDIYTTPREVLEARAREHPAEQDDFDMFGDAGGSKPEPPAAPGNGEAARPAPAAPSQPPQPTAAPPAAASEEIDYASWPVKELTRLLRERGVDTAGLTEKADLVARVREVAAQGPEGEQPTAPEGYVWDPASGMFFSAEAGMYYHSDSGCFYSPQDGKWWRYDAAGGGYSEVPAQGGA